MEHQEKPDMKDELQTTEPLPGYNFIAVATYEPLNSYANDPQDGWSNFFLMRWNPVSEQWEHDQFGCQFKHAPTIAPTSMGPNKVVENAKEQPVIWYEANEGDDTWYSDPQTAIDVYWEEMNDHQDY